MQTSLFIVHHATKKIFIIFLQEVHNQSGWVMVRCDSKYDPISGGNQQSGALNVIGLNCISCESIH
jgi:hypothetical protein